jgi:hypothetical protein
MLRWLVRKCASKGLRRKSKIREAGLGFVDKRSEAELEAELKTELEVQEVG